MGNVCGIEEEESKEGAFEPTLQSVASSVAPPVQSQDEDAEQVFVRLRKDDDNADEEDEDKMLSSVSPGCSLAAFESVTPTDLEFEDWIRVRAPHEVRQWADRLLEIGVSWNSFRLFSSEELVQDLVASDIPYMASRSIVKMALEELKRKDVPLAIYWDLENMPIPSEESGKDLATKLKSALSKYGNLVQFRGYASIGLGLIAQHKRSELQLSGCTLVDCPHQRRKEVADKMIIVDAMEFAAQHPSGATLCFITRDVDYAYMMFALKKNPRLGTIVISRGKAQSTLHMNSDLQLCWESDILGKSESTSGLVPLEDVNGATGTRETPKDSAVRLVGSMGVGEFSMDVLEATSVSSPGSHAVIELDCDETIPNLARYSKEVEMLHNIISRLQPAQGLVGMDDNIHRVSKGKVGHELRRKHPTKFPDRRSVRRFLAKSLSRKIIVEEGYDGPTRTLYLTKWAYVAASDGSRKQAYPSGLTYLFAAFGWVKDTLFG